MPIQIPNDAVSVGYKEVRPYCYEQVFQSSIAAFIASKLGDEVEIPEELI